MQISKFMLFQVWKKPFQNHVFGAREHMPQIYKKTKQKLNEQQTKKHQFKTANFLTGATTITLLKARTLWKIEHEMQNELSYGCAHIAVLNPNYHNFFTCMPTNFWYNHIAAEGLIANTAIIAAKQNRRTSTGLP